MLRFFEFLEEGNKLYKNIEQPLSRGKSVGTVSASRYDKSSKENKENDRSLKGDLARLRKKGAIGGYKSATGRYQDTEKKAGDVDKEKSYVVRQGEGKHSKRFGKVLDALGKRYGQQSTMHIKPNKEAEYHYMSDKKVDKQGKVVYNKPLSSGGGDTSFRGKSSFTTKK